MSLIAKKKSIASPIPVIALCAGLSGCAALDSEYGQPLPLDVAEDFGSGTHYSQVLDRLGPPARMSRLGGGMVLKYEYINLSERQYGLILPGNIGKWFKVVYATGDVYIESMKFVFGGEGTLDSAMAGSQQLDGGGGFSATLIFSVGSLTSIEQYRADAANAEMWGMGLTNDPLRILNSRQTLDTGENGLDSIGSSQTVGQETLELRDSHVN
jgi:hypothetical protein